MDLILAFSIGIERIIENLKEKFGFGKGIALLIAVSLGIAVALVFDLNIFLYLKNAVNGWRYYGAEVLTGLCIAFGSEVIHIAINLGISTKNFIKGKTKK